MCLDRPVPCHERSLIRREGALVVLEDFEVHDCEQAVGGIAGGHPHLLLLEGLVEEPQVHGLHGAFEPQVVGAHQGRKAIRAVDILIAPAYLPGLLRARGIAQGLELGGAGVDAPDHHCEGVVETERRQPYQPEPRVFLLDPREGGGSVAGRQFQNGRQRGAAVLRINVDLAGQQGLVRHKRPAQVQLALDRRSQPVFEMLGDDLSQQHLLGEVLRADDDRPGPRASGQQGQCNQAGDSFRSIHPRPPSATTAMSAAGIAPARISIESRVAKPRNIKTPNPPAPIAAAIVAGPMVVTVATRTPARIVGAASGNSTSTSSWRPVIPMATADSRTAGSTPSIPTSVFRSTGRSAYSTRATIAVRVPIPPISGIGIKNPNSARLGTVCMIFANARDQRRKIGCRGESTPSVIPSAAAMAIESNTSSMCWALGRRISEARPGLMVLHSPVQALQEGAGLAVAGGEKLGGRGSSSRR